MRELELSQGQVALVDDEDFEYLNQWKWSASNRKGKKSLYAHRHAYIDGKDKTIYLHRAIMGVTDPKTQVDHIDLNGLNNQKSNLRLCSDTENRRNRPKYKGATPYKGVTYNKRSKDYVARITYNNECLYIGRYYTAEDAARAYNYSARFLHGEFARFNDVTPGKPHKKPEREASKKRDIRLVYDEAARI